MRRLSMILLLAGALTYSASGSAQQHGIVNVDISEVKPLIAANLGVAVDAIPENVVRVPVTIAADVCGTTEQSLFDQPRTAEELPTCTAKATSDLLDEHIRQLIES